MRASRSPRPRASGHNRPRAALLGEPHRARAKGRQARGHLRPTATRCALVKHLSNIPDDEITALEIPTGQPIVYQLDDALNATDRYYL